MTRSGALATAVMAARGELPAGGEASRVYVGQALKALVMHEVGHTLGLRHNFRGSAGANAAQLASRSWTASHGLGVSVMDYSPPALALDPAQQGDYYASTIGSYDRWAITYGYRDVVTGPSASAAKGGGATADAWTPDVEINGLRAIASQAADPAHLYGTDEDAGFGGLGLDPTVSRYDQTDDPLGWARGRVALIDGLFDSLETRVVAPGQSYGRLRTAFTDLLNDRWYALLVTTKYLGGATTSRDHRGDPGERPAVVNVPAAQQRAALGFLSEAGFGERAYHFPPALLSRLGAERWMHWGLAWSGRPARFPIARLGADAAGLPAGAAARPHGAGPDPRRRAPRRAGRADDGAAGAVRLADHRDLGRGGRRRARPTGGAAQHHIGPPRRSAAASEHADPDDREPGAGHARGRPGARPDDPHGTRRRHRPRARRASARARQLHPRASERSARPHSPGARRPDDPDHHLEVAVAMLHILLPSDPSPLAQATVYMGGMLAGYLLLTQPEEWARVRETVREVWERRPGEVDVRGHPERSEGSPDAWE